jgi:LacI family transcriptional regulator
MVTLRDIAKEAGVTAATVSYVLNGSGKVSEATRERVLKIAKEKGYRSNVLARSLRNNKSNLIGVIVEDVQAKMTPKIIDGINAAAEEKGYQILLSNLRLMSKIDAQFSHISAYQEDIDHAVHTLAGMQVDGIIYVGMHDRCIPHVLGGIECPLVYCYCYTQGEGSSVGYDNTDVMYRLTRMFLEQGHRSFGIIAGRSDSEPSMKRLRGIQKAMDEAGIRIDEKMIRFGDWQYEKAREIAVEMLSGKDRPTAIIALNDEMAVGVRDAAMELQIRIPEDLSVSGFDFSDAVQFVTPHITTVQPQLSRMGQRAMELLLNKIENAEQENITVVLPSKIIDGDSVSGPSV